MQHNNMLRVKTVKSSICCAVQTARASLIAHATRVDASLSSKDFKVQTIANLKFS